MSRGLWAPTYLGASPVLPSGTVPRPAARRSCARIPTDWGTVASLVNIHRMVQCAWGVRVSLGSCVCNANTWPLNSRLPDIEWSIWPRVALWWGGPIKVALISLEPWDQVWRRNQHFCRQLVRQGLFGELVFIEPSSRTSTLSVARAVDGGIAAVTPRLLIPRSAGGLIELGARLRRSLLRNVDVLWINDPALGVHCLSSGQPAVYDVTDDWRAAGFPPRITRRIIRAEDRLASLARTVVCSPALQDRWRSRYGVDAPIVSNGIDLDAWTDVAPRRIEGEGPHVGYVGTLHEHRLDLDLVEAMARHPEVGTVHLIGPVSLSELNRRRLDELPGVVVHGAVDAVEVPGWMTALDVLVSPHLVDEFTLSLDAIKSYEYLASGRPVVATPTSGFQLLNHPRVTVAARQQFAAAVAEAAGRGAAAEVPADLLNLGWDSRARDFWSVIERTGASASATLKKEETST